MLSVEGVDACREAAVVGRISSRSNRTSKIVEVVEEVSFERGGG